MTKVEDVLAAVKLNDLLNRKKDEEVEEKAAKNVVKTIFIILSP